MSFGVVDHFSLLAIWGPPQYKDVVLPVYDSHYKDWTVSQSSYFYNENPHTEKNVFFIELYCTSWNIHSIRFCVFLLLFGAGNIFPYF